MKKALTLVSALIVAAACAAPTNRDVAVDTNRNAARGTYTAPAITEADAIAKEKASWEAIKNKDYAGFESMLADDRVDVLSDGAMDKATSMAGVRQFEPSEFNFSEWKFLPIDKDMFVLVYTVAVKGKYQGKEFPLNTARCASAWVNRRGKWLATFHQECPVFPSPPPPATKGDATKAASPTATPVAPPATGPDPIANEKLVWDLMRSASYDRFADLLAPEFIEVLPDNVYDKAATVKGVRMFDASKAVLSDWKTLKLDDDASLVVYTVTNAGGPPEGERHSTIWVNRSGNWLAVFHHGGTPVAKPSSAQPSPPNPSASPSAK